MPGTGRRIPLLHRLTDRWNESSIEPIATTALVVLGIPLAARAAVAISRAVTTLAAWPVPFHRLPGTLVFATIGAGLTWAFSRSKRISRSLFVGLGVVALEVLPSIIRAVNALAAWPVALYRVPGALVLATMAAGLTWAFSRSKRISRSLLVGLGIVALELLLGVARAYWWAPVAAAALRFSHTKAFALAVIALVLATLLGVIAWIFYVAPRAEPDNSTPTPPAI